MHVVILSTPPDLSAYLVEIFRTWGLPLCKVIEPEALPTLSPSDAPVVVCPASTAIQHYTESLIAYARRGGRVVCFLPGGALAAAAGLESEGEKEVPLRLRGSPGNFFQSSGVQRHTGTPPQSGGWPTFLTPDAMKARASG